MQLIAERTLIFIRDGKTRGRKATLLVYAPICNDASAWRVNYSLNGPGKHSLERYVVAIDALQALQWAIQLMPIELKSVARDLGGRFVFLDDEDRGVRPLALPPGA